MKNKNILSIATLVVVTLLLTGCVGQKQISSTPAETVAPETKTKADPQFSLYVVESPKPVAKAQNSDFVEKVVEPEIAPKVEIRRVYETFDSSLYADFQDEAAAFALFFTKDNCSRCADIDNFLSRNLSVMPNQTKILSVAWDEYPNLQTDFSVKRPATMVFFTPSGETESLFAPPTERVIEFFSRF